MRFELPEFHFSWQDLYDWWIEICLNNAIKGNFNYYIELDVTEPVGIFDEADWVPLTLDVSKIKPRRVLRRGESFLEPHATPASRLTASLLIQYAGNKEEFACVCILACAFQLLQCFPPYWRGVHNHRLLMYIKECCEDRLSDTMKFTWHQSSRNVFPKKYFSQKLLETTSWLTEKQVILFAALNTEYYMSKWMLIRYSYESLNDEYRLGVNRFSNQKLNSPLSNPNSQNALASTTHNSGLDPDLGIAKTSILMNNLVSSEPLSEGRKTTRIVDTIERNQSARRICLEYHGYSCRVCGLDFGLRYGPNFAGIIDVHHINPLSGIHEERLVDPINDLIPLCPNCHRMIHKKPNGVYLPDELKNIVKENRQEFN